LEINNKKDRIILKNVYSPKFNLIKNFEPSSSIYYCFELLDGRLCLCMFGDWFDIYNINDFIEPKKEFKISPGVYIVSSIQAHTEI